MPAQRAVDCCLIEAKAAGDPLIRDLRLGGIPAIGYTQKAIRMQESREQRRLLSAGLYTYPLKRKNPERLTPFAEEFLKQ